MKSLSFLNSVFFSVCIKITKNISTYSAQHTFKDLKNYFRLSAPTFTCKEKKKKQVGITNNSKYKAGSVALLKQ